jgi:hypothetical protein
VANADGPSSQSARKVVEVERVAVDVVLGGHVPERDDHSVDGRESTSMWDEFEPLLEDDLHVRSACAGSKYGTPRRWRPAAASSWA